MSSPTRKNAVSSAPVRRISWMGVLLACLSGLARPVHAQAGGIAASAQPGTFRGVMLGEPRWGARDTLLPLPVAGRARWRFELDSADWRYRLTLRLTFADSARGELVIRTSDTSVPHDVLVSRTAFTDEPHTDPRYFVGFFRVGRGPAAALSGLAMDDTIMLRTPVQRGSDGRPTGQLEGRLRVGAHRPSTELPNAASRQRPILLGEFLASWDPRPVVLPASMSDSLQQAILRRALSDAGLHWLDAQMHIRAADSVHDARLLRAYLVNRYGAALLVDTVATDFTHIFMRVRGRYAPIVCQSESGREACRNTRSWWSRLHLRGD
jgi:hypothetical protein